MNILQFLLMIERLVPNRDTQHMIGTRADGRLKVRLGSGACALGNLISQIADTMQSQRVP
jgi:hypothetical protein